MDKRNRSPYRRWSKETILNEISKQKEVSAKQIQHQRSDLYGAAVRYFGSWKNAVEATGRDYSQVRKNKAFGYWTEQTIIERISKLTEKHSAFARKNNADLYNAALRFFGSWEQAVRAAGFDYSKIQKGWPPKRKKAR